MDTTVGLEELVVPLGLDLVFLVREPRRAAITGGPNARGASPRPSNAIIRRTRPKVEGQGFSTVMMRQANGGRWPLHWWQILLMSKIVQKQATMVI